MCLKIFLKQLRAAGTSVFDTIKKGDVQHTKPILELSKEQTILPTIIVSLLFFLWGFAYGLLDTMNYHVRNVMDLERESSAVLAAGYYFAYIPGTLLFSGPMVRKCGYRVAFVAGLTIFALGNFFISVAAQNYTFVGMVTGMFVVGLGVSTLERSANPYVVNCGPRTQATLRILVAQGMAGVGTVVAPLVAKKFLFDEPGKQAATPMDSIITLYRGVGGITIALAALAGLLFFRTSIVPEAPQHEPPMTTCRWKLWKHPLVSMKYSRLWWAAAANFVNLGCQVTFAQFFIDQMVENADVDKGKGAVLLSVAQTAFVVGRYAAAILVAWPKTFKPRFVLFGFIAGAIAFTAAGAFVKTTSAVIACAVMVMFFEAPSFPMIFESADAGLGEWSSTGETIMIVSICGGALQPPLFGLLFNHVGISKAWLLTASCFALVWSYCWATNLLQSFRKAIDAAECDGNDDENAQDGNVKDENEKENDELSRREEERSRRARSLYDPEKEIATN